LEHQDLEDNVRALGDELRRLADYLRRTPSPSTPVLVYRTPSPGPPVLEETPRRRIQLTDQPVGDSSVISSIYPTGPRVIEVVVPEPLPATSLSRSASNASSLQSYLPSHHSDDDLFEEIEETSILSPVRWPSEELSVGPSTPHVTSSSSISSSPLSRSTMTSEATTVMQQAPEVLQRALQGIRDQLRALEDGQAAARNLLESLHERPEDHAGELAERLQRIEALIQTLLDQGHPRGPEIIYEPPVSRTMSISESTDSLQRLRSILRDLATPADIETRHMPLPTTARAGPSVAQQLDEILSSAHVPSTTPAELPRIEPFVYRPSGRGARARSVSPSSIEIPPRSQTVPVYYPITAPGRLPTRRRGRREPSEPEDITLHDPPPRPRPSDAERRILRDQGPEQSPRFHVGPGPPPQPVLVRF
jgi:hypothetical protein